MLIVRLIGGLCNQIYGYMAGYALAQELRQELVLDIEECVRSAFGYSLDYFNIPISRKIVYSWDVILTDEKGFYDRVLETFQNFTILVQSEEHKNDYMDNDRVIVYSGLDMAEELRSCKNLYMPGYFFQCDRYYQKYWDELKILFTLKKENEDIQNFRKMIYGKNSVGIHIRRRDMLLVDWSYKVEDGYYRAAIEYCRELYDNCTFYVFSDDIEYAQKMLGADSSIHYIHFYGYDNASVNEFCCLALCNHRILTIDSTFGALADDFSTKRDGHVFIRDRKDENKNKIAGRNKRRWIYLNTDDIQIYSNKYRYADSKLRKPCGEGYERFLELVEKNRNHEALQLAYCIYQENRSNEKFRLYYAKLLERIGAYEEAVIELAQLSPDVVEQYFEDVILDVQIKNQLISLYNQLHNVRNKHFIIVLKDKVLPEAGYDDTYGLVDLAIILSHLGYMTTVVFGVDISSEKCNTKINNYMYNVRGINMGCFHIGKEEVLEMGVPNFYNHFAEDELIIFSRDVRFFEKDDCIKKLCFITTDATDLKDREIVSGVLNDRVCAILGRKADFILTRSSELATKDKKYIYWQDKGFDEKFICVEFPWQYGYGRRLNQRMIGMAEALVNL